MGFSFENEDLGKNIKTNSNYIKNLFSGFDSASCKKKCVCNLF